MLESNGRQVTVKHNLHIEPEEFYILADYVKKEYEMKWFVMIIVQFSLGLRCSEMLNIHLSDFKDHFNKLDYRQAKTNKMIFGEPIPEEVRKVVLAYIISNGHRLKDGWLFPRHWGNGPMTTETYNTYWCKWRKALGKNKPTFLDKYPTEGGKHIHRISSHSLRRLHRTMLADKHPDRLFLLSKICHYDKFERFLVYINDYKMMKERMGIIMPIINPVVSQILHLPPEQKRLNFY